MKRLNPKTNLPFKYGDVREDGYVFKGYNKTKIKKDGFFKENWHNFNVFVNLKLTKAIWKKENKEKVKCINKNYCKKNKEKVVQSKKNYYLNNKGKFNGYNSTRRATKLNATPSWLTNEHKKEITEMYRSCLEISKQTGAQHHVDHIVPLKGKEVCGLHVPWNLQILTATENLSKNNRLIEH